MSLIVRLNLPIDYPERILMLQQYRWWLEDQGATYRFILEDEQHLPRTVSIEHEEDATAFKLKFAL